MSEYTTKQAVEFAASGQSADFKKAINDLLMSRVSDAIELKKVEVAANFMSNENEEPETEGESNVDQEV